MSFPKVSIFGVPISKMSMKDTVAYLSQVIARREPHQVITANPIMVMTALEHPDYMQMMKEAELVVPDGAGVVWASGYVGNPVAERVTGFDLIQELMKAGERQGWKVYLVGAAPMSLRQRRPGCRSCIRESSLSVSGMVFW